MIFRTSAILLLSLGTLILIVTSAEDGDCLIEEKIDYYGNDLEQFKNVPSKEECSEKAAAVEDAKFWTYQTKSKTCYSKTSKDGKKAHPNGVSGNVECANGQEGELKNSSYNVCSKYVCSKYVCSKYGCSAQ